jgi:hypothetical protein
MFFFRSLCLTAISWSFLTMTYAQMTIQDPTSWKYEARKTDTGQFFVFMLSLEKGWHIWSMEPGGDGFQIPPSFLFDDNNQVEILGPAMEKGVLETAEMEGIEGAVRYYSDTVEYIQPVRLTAGARQVSGRHVYQVCNDRMCLPPVEKDFSIEVARDE